MSSMWDDESTSMVDAGSDYAGSSSSSSADWANGLLSAFGTAANVYGRVAVADINANARYPMYGMYGQQGMYQQRGAGVQISPMVLLLIAGAVWLASK